MEKEGGGERKREAERDTGRETAKPITQLVVGRALDPNAKKPGGMPNNLKPRGFPQKLTTREIRSQVVCPTRGPSWGLLSADFPDSI